MSSLLTVAWEFQAFPETESHSARHMPRTVHLTYVCDTRYSDIFFTGSKAQRDTRLASSAPKIPVLRFGRKSRPIVGRRAIASAWSGRLGGRRFRLIALGVAAQLDGIR